MGKSENNVKGLLLFFKIVANHKPWDVIFFPATTKSFIKPVPCWEMKGKTIIAHESPAFAKTIHEGNLQINDSILICLSNNIKKGTYTNDGE